MRAYLRILISCLMASSLISPGAPAKDAKEVTGEARAEMAGQTLLGKPAPRLRLKSIDGQEIDLGELYGKKAVYLEFWATWCIPCRQQMPHLQHTYETAGPDLAVIAINSGFNDSVEDVRTFRQKIGLTAPIVVDNGEAAAAFNLRVTPQHIVIGRDGRVRYVGHDAGARLDSELLAARSAMPASSDAPGTIEPVNTPRYGVGDQLPKLSAKTLDGRSFPLADANARRPTVLVFLSPWCEWYLATTRPALSSSCRQVREQVDALAKQQPGVRWLGIASGLWANEGDLSGYKTKHGTRIPLALDASGELFHSFRIMNVPTILILDANGHILRQIEGFNPGLPAEIGRLSTVTLKPGNIS